MGNLFIVETVFDSNRIETFWYLFGRWRELLQFKFVYIGSDSIKILKKVQKDEFRRDDDISTKYADEIMERLRSFNSYCLSVCLPKLLRKMKILQYNSTNSLMFSFILFY